MQYGMIIDLDRCVGCHACVIACKAEWDVPTEFARNWVRHLGPAKIGEEMAMSYYVGLCNHCADPVCVTDCPGEPLEVTFSNPKTGEKKTATVPATWKDPIDGTVQIDKSRCIGCGACIEACPYHARYLNPALIDAIGSDGKADKCTYCKPRFEQGLPPACVQTCITGARIFGDLDDPASEVAQYVKKGAVGLEAKGGNLGPNSRYFGKKKDMDLLFSTSTPELAGLEKAGRRALMAKIMQPAMKAAGELTVLGLVGAAAVKALADKE
ncbi:MAG: 4Fe-4S dicluster domain-containing protein [Desulfobulbaceae bacterium]|jgi:tetrathionate reductase subunit B|nr:4Fe-4S dicluster domain-containing protein [Desulfobulbaceae bacterium]